MKKAIRIFLMNFLAGLCLCGNVHSFNGYPDDPNDCGDWSCEANPKLGDKSK